jgi:hypothetical protein
MERMGCHDQKTEGGASMKEVIITTKERIMRDQHNYAIEASRNFDKWLNTDDEVYLRQSKRAWRQWDRYDYMLDKLRAIARRYRAQEEQAS